jgi:phytanoyl-CoA hydroxylase
MMTTLDNQKWNTEHWTGQERIYDPPNWHGVSPEVVARRGRPWNQTPASAPWLDQEGAGAQIDAKLRQGAISSEEAVLLHQWVNDGYFILEGAVPSSDFDVVDEYVRDLDGLWTTDQEIRGLQVMSLHIKGRRPGPIDHAEILSWPMEKRLDVRDNQLWRIHYFHPHTAAGLALTKAEKILRMCSLLLGAEPVLINGIGLKFGSQSGLHQDLCAYHIHPANHLVGIWLAAEDVNPAAGPLEVYPGSHRAGLWPGWRNYPQTSLRTCHLETRDAEAAFLAKSVAGIEGKPLPVKKGDAIFQHGLLIHGADRITDRQATRYSMVLHYSVKGGDRMHEVEGPFNW